MKTRWTILACFVLSLGYETASAEPNHPVAVPANSCPLPQDSKDYQDLKIALQTSQGDVNKLIKVLKSKNCDKTAVEAFCKEHQDLEACKTPPPPPVVVTPQKTTTRPPKKQPEPPQKKPTPEPEKGKGGANAYVTLERVTLDPGSPNACVRMTSWTDVNGNLKMDESEKRRVETVCNGKDGKPGKNGANAGVVTGERFKTDSRCSGRAGSYIDGYTDLNGNGKLDKGEPFSHVGVTCDAIVAKAHDGRDGRPGHDGTTVYLGFLTTGDLFYSQKAPNIRSSAFGLSLGLEHSWAEAAIGAAWSPGIKHGTVFTADFSAYLLWDRVGPRIGTELIYADIDSHNQARYQLMVVTPGIAVRVLDDRHWKVRAEAHALVGLVGTYSQFSTTYGAGGSISLLYGF